MVPASSEQAPLHLQMVREIGGNSQLTHVLQAWVICPVASHPLLVCLLSGLQEMSTFLMSFLLLIVLYVATKAEQILWVTQGTRSKIKVKDCDGRKPHKENILQSLQISGWELHATQQKYLFLCYFWKPCACQVQGQRYYNRGSFGISGWSSAQSQGGVLHGGGVLIPLLLHPLMENRIREYR